MNTLFATTKAHRCGGTCAGRSLRRLLRQEGSISSGAGVAGLPELAGRAHHRGKPGQV